MHELSAHEVAKAGASSLSKLALSAGSMARELWEGRIRLADGGGYEPILVYESTYIGRHRDLYSFVVGPILVSPPTNIGRFIAL